ncbi:hypothetical protein H0E87_027840 [Populus deltoides]|uniref:Glutamate--ammonia ligase n=1 Tax=Populus deltoides TaxID=3696 RepID=A0A8T2WPF3_POPDE|nr:hypothetical protein H0E87_027840 [Populus deltoides]
MDTSYFCSEFVPLGIFWCVADNKSSSPSAASELQSGGQYPCGGGVDKAFGPDIVDAHYKACLLAGINFSGINGEVMPGQVGLLVCISAGDELWAAGHILERIIDVAGVVLPFDPKPIQANFYFNLPFYYSI